jgi:protein involved in polysaccharide export with SLBB domain
MMATAGLAAMPHVAAQTRADAVDAQESGGPIRLTQPRTGSAEVNRDVSAPLPRTVAVGSADEAGAGGGNSATAALSTPAGAADFDAYVRSAAGGVRVLRLGASLVTPSDAAVEANPQIPPDYLIQPGDEVQLTLWGSVDADLRILVDRSGRVSVPRVGSIMLAGVRYADLPAVISQRVGTVFKNFQLSASLGKLRGQRVYVTGFVGRPGSYTVSSLATLLGALVAAGGPSASGSFRDIQLRRGEVLVATFDLYDLLLKGDRSKDRVLQPDDVIFVGPVGVQVGVIGSVNRPAIVELKPGETIADALRMTGGLSAVADTRRLAIERLDDRASVRVAELALPDANALALSNGDVLRAFNSVATALPIQGQNRRVVVEGEVARPGEYILPPNTTLMDAVRAAGGLTTSAFLYGTDLSRESVRVTQQANYDRALRDLELELSRSASTQRTSNAEEAAAQAGRQSAASRIADRLRQIRPSGRVVLQLPFEGGTLPDLTVEDGDRLYIPPRPTSVGVFGSVFNAGNYLYEQRRTMDDYLRLAGGPTKGADDGSLFVVRANGTVISRMQSDGRRRFWGGAKFSSLAAEPGDTIFVPEQFDKTTFVQIAKDWTQVLYQLGLGAAGLKALGLF